MKRQGTNKKRYRSSAEESSDADEDYDNLLRRHPHQQCNKMLRILPESIQGESASPKSQLPLSSSSPPSSSSSHHSPIMNGSSENKDVSLYAEQVSQMMMTMMMMTTLTTTTMTMTLMMMTMVTMMIKMSTK